MALYFTNRNESTKKSPYTKSHDEERCVYPCVHACMRVCALHTNVKLDIYESLSICCPSCSDGIEPVYTLMREPVTGDCPQFLVMEVQLPGIVSTRW